ncbi:MAG: hypothetical protein COB67_00450 [SAR324 cluster bacterium]|uniref:Uncharacterized protein n=1 Tax=SAR324 cluster bacterium TaxID=2024889 RepID=A0A2A4TBQ6_9DELT|nr:MAG: hypothetical protein COB67_00450 [SAR324 cluster bacterium]
MNMKNLPKQGVFNYFTKKTTKKGQVMELTKEWKKVLLDIYSLFDDSFTYKISIEVPSKLHVNINSNIEDVLEEHLKYLSTRYVKIIKTGHNNDVTEPIKVWFGNNRVIKNDLKEIVIEFEYASKLIPNILSTLNPIEVSVVTRDDLYYRENAFSQPYSTLKGTL